MNFHLPTREECQEIVKSTDAFYCAERVVEGQKVEIYDYRLASLTDFIENKAFELRGLCFVEKSDGTWERNILLNKFFNVGQTDGWLEEDLKDKKIVSIQNKEDGSIISAVKFENGKIRMKSKMSFDSDQAKMSQDYLDNHPILLEEIDKLLKDGLTPVFEGVGYENQIVLEYKVPFELRLLQIRKADGTYLPVKTLHNYSVPMCTRMASRYNVKVIEDICANYSVEMAIKLIGNRKFQSFNEFTEFFGNGSQGKMSVLDFILLSRDYIENQEGEVISFEDGQMAKVKNTQYLQLHGLIGPDAFRENLLIKTILDGNIDDVLGALVPGPKKDKILAIEKAVNEKFNHLVVEFKILRGAYFNIFNENRKEFALANKKHLLFGTVMKNLNGKFSEVETIAEKAVTEYITKQTNSLGKAKEFVEGL